RVKSPTPSLEASGPDPSLHESVEVQFRRGAGHRYSPVFEDARVNLPEDAKVCAGLGIANCDGAAGNEARVLRHFRFVLEGKVVKQGRNDTRDLVEPGLRIGIEKAQRIDC